MNVRQETRPRVHVGVSPGAGYGGRMGHVEGQSTQAHRLSILESSHRRGGKSKEELMCVG